ncbi:uncharacterized protein BX664DRAFT_327861 [Halteromyces radiatus]|uniref:uncharacterized protein n=1 Tax=Halteromyces radiatus TaxID=101107 RepID=UPI0022203225|nr:uncharacterized protein BX664DRAFT_327861 [Halteromyces radiatus]KAI8092670.1 hypothetical protein BX664DRAFT_327861 [Halteromyces radiatus]
MFANTAYFPGYPQSQAPNTSGMNASQTQVPDHSQLNLPNPAGMTGSFHGALPQDYSHGKTKRKQVKNACVNCQKACKKCDEQRPCPRCVKYGLTETCVNSVRKERKKGIKRGPYKKRKQGANTSTDSSAATTPNMSVPALSNGMYSTATSGVAVSRAGNAPIAYQPYGNTAQFETFANFQNGAQYLPYNILNNMNTMLQQAAAANANGANEAEGQQQQQQQQQQPQTQSQQTQQQQQQQQETADNRADADENGKLSILSQLCTAVLDRAPTNDSSSTVNNNENNNNNNNNNNSNDTSIVKDETSEKVNSTSPQSSTHEAPANGSTETDNAVTEDKSKKENDGENGTSNPDDK